MKILILLLVSLVAISSLDNGLGLTPQMGWNSWNHFACDVNETVVKQTADLIIQLGLDKKGYQYINIDDCWQISRNATTKEIIEDPERFPSGIPALVKYIHDKGLKIGLYSDAGEFTCQRRPGSLGYEQVDANTYAKWEIDYLKYDNCYNQRIDPKKRYPPMQEALNKSGRAIFFSMCEWGQEDPWLWAPSLGNSWRTTGDIKDNWLSFVTILDANANLYLYSKPGAWNDPDMLEVGNGGMTTSEYQAHFALWAMLKAPLLIGCDLSKASKETLDILGNSEIIAINQDKLGKQGRRLRTTDSVEVWYNPLVDGMAVILFNRGLINRQAKFTLAEIGFSSNKAKIRDLVIHKDLGQIGYEFTTIVKSHSVQVYKLTKYGMESKND